MERDRTSDHDPHWRIDRHETLRRDTLARLDPLWADVPIRWIARTGTFSSANSGMSFDTGALGLIRPSSIIIIAHTLPDCRSIPPK